MRRNSFVLELQEFLFRYLYKLGDLDDNQLLEIVLAFEIALRRLVLVKTDTTNLHHCVGGAYVRRNPKSFSSKPFPFATE